jgi:hypothetical protein
LRIGNSAPERTGPFRVDQPTVLAPGIGGHSSIGAACGSAYAIGLITRPSGGKKSAVDFLAAMLPIVPTPRLAAATGNSGRWSLGHFTCEVPRESLVYDFLVVVI